MKKGCDNISKGRSHDTSVSNQQTRELMSRDKQFQTTCILKLQTTPAEYQKQSLNCLLRSSRSKKLSNRRETARPLCISLAQLIADLQSSHSC